MPVIKKIALLLSIVLVVGACAGLIVHQTTEGTQSVVKRPADASETIVEVPVEDDRIFLFVPRGTHIGLSASVVRGEQTLDPFIEALPMFVSYDDDSYDLYIVEVGDVIVVSGEGSRAQDGWYIKAADSTGSLVQVGSNYHSAFQYTITDDYQYIFVVQYTV